MKKALSVCLVFILLLGLMPTVMVQAESGDLSSISVTADTWQIEPEETVQLNVIAKDSDGNIVSGAEFTYESILPSVAIVNENGLVTAVSLGITEIIVTAQLNGTTKSETVAISVANTSDRETFEEMAPNAAPVFAQAGKIGFQSAGTLMATVTNVRCKDGTKAVCISDTRNDATASLLYTGNASGNLTLDFDLFSEYGTVTMKVVNESASNANTAFWIVFQQNKTRYYSYNSANAKYEYTDLSTTVGCSRNEWVSVHLDVNNAKGEAEIYINDEFIGVAPSVGGSTYGTSAKNQLNSVAFSSSGTSTTGDVFYIDNLKLSTAAVSYEDMVAGSAPASQGGYISSQNTVVKVNPKSANTSRMTAYLNGYASGSTAANMYYAGSKDTELSLDFDLCPVSGVVTFKILNGTNATANTAFWIKLQYNGVYYYDGSTYQKIADTGYISSQWNAVHVDVTNTGDDVGADIYLNGVLVGSAPKCGGNYGSNTIENIDGVFFHTNGGTSATPNHFYLDNLKLSNVASPEEEPGASSQPLLEVDMGGRFYIASNDDQTGLPMEETHYAEDFADGYGFNQIAVTFAHTDESGSVDQVFVNYCRHRDIIMDDPTDSVKVYTPETLLNAHQLTEENPSVIPDLRGSMEDMQTSKDLITATMVQLPDGRMFAQNYINYFRTATTARTVSWIIDGDTWTKVEGTLTLPESIGVDEPHPNSTWYQYGFSKGIELLDDGDGTYTILNTMYGANRAILVQSTDLGQTWTLRSIIAENDGTQFNTDGSLIEWYEPSLVRCSDGSLLSILRTYSNKPLYQCRSTDNGLTWSEPILLPGVEPTQARSIYPHTYLISNGVLVLATGRPDNILLFSLDGSGYRWDAVEVTYGVSDQTMTTGNSSIAEIAPGQLLVVGDEGFVQDQLAHIWGKVVTVTRNRMDNPVLEDAILRAYEKSMPTGATLNLKIDGVFDSNSDLISDYDVTFISHNLELATVDQNGTVTALSNEGTAKFTARVTCEGKEVATNSVEIIIRNANKLDHITTGAEQWCVLPGETGQITNTAFGYFDNVLDASWAYESLDTDIVTVNSSGLVTAVAPGVADIKVTATVADQSLERLVTFIVDSGCWITENFESGIPGTYTSSTACVTISTENAFSGEKSVYIKDDSPEVSPFIYAPIAETKGVVVEFMIYPVKMEHTSTIGIGSGDQRYYNNTCLFSFSCPDYETGVQPLLTNDGTASSFARRDGTNMDMNQWNKVRVEMTLDKPSRIYVDDQFISECPVAYPQDIINRICFSTGGLAPVDDYYYIDDLKIMTFETVDEQ